MELFPRFQLSDSIKLTLLIIPIIITIVNKDKAVYLKILFLFLSRCVMNKAMIIKIKGIAGSINL